MYGYGNSGIRGTGMARISSKVMLPMIRSVSQWRIRIFPKFSSSVLRWRGWRETPGVDVFWCCLGARKLKSASPLSTSVTAWHLRQRRTINGSLFLVPLAMSYQPRATSYPPSTIILVPFTLPLEPLVIFPIVLKKTVSGPTAAAQQWRKVCHLLCA